MEFVLFTGWFVCGWAFYHLHVILHVCCGTCNFHKWCRRWTDLSWIHECVQLLRRQRFPYQTFLSASYGEQGSTWTLRESSDGWCKWKFSVFGYMIRNLVTVLPNDMVHEGRFFVQVLLRRICSLPERERHQASIQRTRVKIILFSYEIQDSKNRFPRSSLNRGRLWAKSMLLVKFLGFQVLISTERILLLVFAMYDFVRRGG